MVSLVGKNDPAIGISRLVNDLAEGGGAAVPVTFMEQPARTANW